MTIKLTAGKPEPPKKPDPEVAIWAEPFREDDPRGPIAIKAMLVGDDIAKTVLLIHQNGTFSRIRNCYILGIETNDLGQIKEHTASNDLPHSP